MFVNIPEAVPAGAVTGTDIVHVPGVVALPAGMVPPTNMIEVAVVEVVPPQVFDVTLTGVNGAGKISVKRAPVYGEPVGFCKVISRVVVPPAEKVDGVNRFANPIS